MSTPFPRAPAPKRSSFVMRHRTAITVGALLASAAGAGFKMISDARAERRMIEVPAADVVGLRQDIGYLRGDLRDERREREKLADTIGEFRVEINGRITRLETIEDSKFVKKGTKK